MSLGGHFSLLSLSTADRGVSIVSSSCGGGVDQALTSAEGGVAVPNMSSLLKKKSLDLASSASAKKRDDLTCLGSDDSGIICNSEHEHSQAVTHKSHKGPSGASRDSISSTGTDTIEENEDEMFSHGEGDEDDEERGMRSRTPSDEEQGEHCGSSTEERRMRESVVASSEAASGRGNSSDGSGGASKATRSALSQTGVSINGPVAFVPKDARVLSTMANGIKVLSPNRHDHYEVTSSPAASSAAATSSSGKDHKNDVMFKNFFGATKNAIFRTAQSIIDNHEKKSSHKKLSIELAPGEGWPIEDAALPASPISSGSTPTQSGHSSEHSLATTTNTSSPPSGTSPVLSPTSETAPVIASPPKKREFFMLKPKMPVFHLSSGPHKATQQVTASDCAKETAGGKRLPGTAVHQCQGVKEQRGQTEDQPIGSALAKSALKTTPDMSVDSGTIANGTGAARSAKADHNGLLRFFESPIFNIHFAVHYLFYSKEPGVLMFIANKIFSFPDDEVDLYMPQLVLMYTQMDELADILDSYLVYRCRKSVDFSLKCAWLLESYNLNVLESMAIQHGGGGSNSGNAKATVGLVANKVSRLYLLRELYPKRERKFHQHLVGVVGMMDHVLHVPDVQSPMKKTHHRSQSDATGLLSGGCGGNSSGGSGGNTGSGGIAGGSGAGSGVGPGGSLVGNGDLGRSRMLHGLTTSYPKPLALGDLTTGRAFDNGCLCFGTVRGTVNDLRGQKTVCACGAPKLLPEREFMKILIDIGRTLTSLPTKSEKTTALRMFLNLINKNLPARVWLPLYSDIPHHVVRITEDKTAVLNSKDKTPYIIYVEVVEVNDIYTSPVMPKLMPTLRHTKSEEHLETALEAAAANRQGSGASGGGNGGGGGGQQPQMKKDLLRASLSANVAGAASSLLKPDENGEDVDKSSNRSSSESGFDLRVREDDVWSQEDDEITAQYLQMQKLVDRDAVSQLSMDSCDSKDQGKWL